MSQDRSPSIASLLSASLDRINALEGEIKSLKKENSGLQQALEIIMTVVSSVGFRAKEELFEATMAVEEAMKQRKEPV